MQYFITLTNSPSNGLSRTALVLNFNWAIHEDEIKVPLRAYFKKSNGDLDGTIPFQEKILTIDNKDRIDLTTGNVVVESDYNEEDYPQTIGQYNAMMGLNIGQLKAQGFNITDSTTIAEIILGLIKVNIIESDVIRHKFD